MFNDAAGNYICEREGMLGREMFAIDGVKLSSNASKARSGSRGDFERQAGKLEAAAQAMQARHPDFDNKSRTMPRFFID